MFIRLPALLQGLTQKFLRIRITRLKRSRFNLVIRMRRDFCVRPCRSAGNRMNIDALIKKKRAVVIGVVLFALTWAVYGQTLRYDFVNYDDDVYVYANPTILRGLIFSNIGWAFAHFF